MKLSNLILGKLFLLSALFLLLIGLFFGVLAAICYVSPSFLKDYPGFVALRPLHVSATIFWILSGAVGTVLLGTNSISKHNTYKPLSFVVILLWLIGISGVLISYLKLSFGGREYWEFNPLLAIIFLIAWVGIIFVFFKAKLNFKSVPVYHWMWMTGLVFFMFIFIENYLWIFPYFRKNVITDIAVQWKVNGSMVGAWNQMIYGTAIYLMDKISGNAKYGKSKIAYALYFLGLFNLMFNWSHHIYILPTFQYVKYVGYLVSMTEWFILIRIFWLWKSKLNEIQTFAHLLSYRFLAAADFWIIINLTHALFISIPAFNLYTHGTHITVAHAMGTTIGINTMILFSACFEFLGNGILGSLKYKKILGSSFVLIQFSLIAFFVILNIAGIKKSIWLHRDNSFTFSEMMLQQKPWFTLMLYSGVILAISISIPTIILLKYAISKQNLIYKEIKPN